MWQKPKKQLTTKEQVYDYALTLLGNRDYSERDLRSRFKQRQVAPELADITIAKLKDYGFLDEKRYAQRVFEAWRAKRVYGAMHLRAELAKKMVADPLIPFVMNQLSAEEEEERALAAYALSQKRRDGKYDCSTKEGVAALGRYLGSRGFGPGPITRVLNIARRELAKK